MVKNTRAQYHYEIACYSVIQSSLEMDTLQQACVCTTVRYIYTELALSGDSLG